MRIVFFTHSLLSDWNHGNAHFLRGVATELIHRGHEVRVFEPKNAWSLQNLLHEQGPAGLSGFHVSYPDLQSQVYDPASPGLDEKLQGADMVLVHEWSEHDLVAAIGEHRARKGDYSL